MNGIFIKVKNRDIELPPNYNPLEDNNPYMNDVQLAYFKKILIDWKDQLNRKTLDTIHELGDDSINKKSSEDVDMMDNEVETLTILRSRDRHRKLMHKIDDAVLRIETGTYGYCVKSGEEIGIKRLLARPVATLSINMQKIHENDEDFKEDAEYTHKILEMEDSDES